MISPKQLAVIKALEAPDSKNRRRGTLEEMFSYFLSNLDRFVPFVEIYRKFDCTPGHLYTNIARLRRMTAGTYRIYSIRQCGYQMSEVPRATKRP